MTSSPPCHTGVYRFDITLNHLPVLLYTQWNMQAVIWSLTSLCRLGQCQYRITLVIHVMLLRHSWFPHGWVERLELYTSTSSLNYSVSFPHSSSSPQHLWYAKDMTLFSVLTACRVFIMGIRLQWLRCGAVFPLSSELLNANGIFVIIRQLSCSRSSNHHCRLASLLKLWCYNEEIAMDKIKTRQL